MYTYARGCCVQKGFVKPSTLCRMRPRLNEAAPGPAPRASSPAWAIEDQAWRARARASGTPLPHAPAGARPAANRIERRIASVTALAKGKAAAPSSQGAMPPFTGDDVPGRRACPEVDRVRRQRSLPPRKNRDRTDCLHAEGMSAEALDLIRRRRPFSAVCRRSARREPRSWPAPARWWRSRRPAR